MIFIESQGQKSVSDGVISVYFRLLRTMRNCVKNILRLNIKCLHNTKRMDISKQSQLLECLLHQFSDNIAVYYNDITSTVHPLLKYVPCWLEWIYVQLSLTTSDLYCGLFTVHCNYCTMHTANNLISIVQLLRIRDAHVYTITNHVQVCKITSVYTNMAARCNSVL